MMRRLVVALLAVLALTLTACGSSSSSGSSMSPTDALAAAKKTLDGTSGVHVKITSSGVPTGQMALVGGDGVLTRTPPAFKGSVSIANIPTLGTQTVDAVVLDGKVHVKVPVLGWQVVNPKDYGIPDPTLYLDTTNGLSSLLSPSVTTGLTAGAATRTGANNDVIVTPYSGTIHASALATLFPGVSGDFRVTWQIDGQGQLDGAILTGPFYAGSTTTYTIALDQYGTAPTITAP